MVVDQLDGVLLHVVDGFGGVHNDDSSELVVDQVGLRGHHVDRVVVLVEYN